MGCINEKNKINDIKIKAIKLSPANYFTWASGWHSPIYCDNRKILSFPEARKLVYESFAEVIAEKYPEVEVVAGVAPSCTETGLTDGSKCSVCGEILVEQGCNGPVKNMHHELNEFIMDQIGQ